MASVSVDRRFGVTGNKGVKAPVRVATTANITLSGFQTIDGVALASGDENLRVLVKNQTNSVDNGIWDASSGTWARAVDADSTQDLAKGTSVLVNEGTQAGQFWGVSSADPVQPGTTSMTWALSLQGSLSSLTFLQSGSGAVSRSAQEKMRDIVSAFDYMTTTEISDVEGGTATLTVTTALENAISECKTTGNILYLPAGTYGISESTANFGLYINQDMTMTGAGMERTVLKNKSTTGAGVRCAAGYIIISDMTIDQNSSTGIAFRQGGQYSKTQNLVIKNQAGSSYAFVVDGSTGADIESLTLIECSNGIDIGPSLPTNYVNFKQINVEIASGKALRVSQSSGLRFTNFYIEPTNNAGNLEKCVYITGSFDIGFFGFSSELGGTHALTDSGYFEINNSKNINFYSGYISHSGTASKIIFYLTGTTNQNINFDGFEIISTKAGMTLFDNSSTGLVGMSIRNIRTNLTSAATGVLHTNSTTRFTMQNWIDGNAACIFTLNAIHSFVVNVPGNIAVTEQADQVFVNCIGTFSGTGSSSCTKMACGSVHQLDVGNKNDGAAIRGINTGATFTDRNIISRVAIAAGTGYDHYSAFSNNVEVYRVRGDGNVMNTNNSYGAISDIHFKIDIKDASSQWEDVKAMRFRKYRLKQDPEGKMQIGVIAQELEEISPGLVETTPDYTEKDENGHREFLGTYTKSVKYSILSLKIAKAVQEAIERIEKLESKIH
jgi:hypothetical protein